jgi:hypothetical protein
MGRQIHISVPLKPHINSLAAIAFLRLRGRARRILHILLKSGFLSGMLRCVRFLAAYEVRALAAVLGIDVAVHRAVEFIRAVETRTGAHEGAVGKPVM